jgi:hypothetical protein
MAHYCTAPALHSFAGTNFVVKSIRRVKEKANAGLLFIEFFLLLNHPPGDNLVTMGDFKQI